MKRFLLLAAFAAFLSGKSSAAISLHSSATIVLPGNEELFSPLPELPLLLSTMKVKDIEKMTGKKLSLKEKIGLFILKSKLKRQSNNETVTDNGKTAFLLGLLSLICFFIPFVNFASLFLAILAVVIGKKQLRKNPSDKKAKTGVTLGWITLGIFAVALILVIILIAAFSGVRIV